MAFELVLHKTNLLLINAISTAESTTTINFIGDESAFSQPMIHFSLQLQNQKRITNELHR
jgi:hypothetical protein